MVCNMSIVSTHTYIYIYISYISSWLVEAILLLLVSPRCRNQKNVCWRRKRKNKQWQTRFLSSIVSKSFKTTIWTCMCQNIGPIEDGVIICFFVWLNSNHMFDKIVLRDFSWPGMICDVAAASPLAPYPCTLRWQVVPSLSLAYSIALGENGGTQKCLPWKGINNCCWKFETMVRWFDSRPIVRGSGWESQKNCHISSVSEPSPVTMSTQGRCDWMAICVQSMVGKPSLLVRPKW